MGGSGALGHLGLPDDDTSRTTRRARREGNSYRRGAAIYERDRLQRLDKDRRVADGISAAQDVRNAYNQFWWDYGTKLTEDHRTSLIVEPRDGKIPALTPGAQKRWERRAARMHPADGPEDRNLWERCLMGPSTEPPMNPSVYNNNVRLLQTPITS